MRSNLQHTAAAACVIQNIRPRHAQILQVTQCTPLVNDVRQIDVVIKYSHHAE